MTSVFILGATGLIGNEVALQFIRKGYQVYGLARTEEKAKHLQTLEIKTVVGTGKDVSIWGPVAERVDIIVEAMADYKDNESQEVVYQEIARIAKLRSNISILYTNGIWQYGNSNEVITEHNTLTNSPNLVKSRVILGQKYIDLGAILILPSLVYGGNGAHSAYYFRSVEKGEITLFNTPDQYQSYIHYIDIASMYVAAAERASSLRGESFIAADHIHKVVDVVHAIASSLGKEIKINYVEPSNDYYECLALNQRASNSKAKIKLNWTPTQRSLIDDPIKYYNAWKSLPTNTNYFY
eukprot:gene1460-1840_t